MKTYIIDGKEFEYVGVAVEISQDCVMLREINVKPDPKVIGLCGAEMIITLEQFEELEKTGKIDGYYLNPKPFISIQDMISYDGDNMEITILNK